MGIVAGFDCGCGGRDGQRGLGWVDGVIGMWWGVWWWERSLDRMGSVLTFFCPFWGLGGSWVVAWVECGHGGWDWQRRFGVGR